jgi:hypothetical protein
MALSEPESLSTRRRNAFIFLPLGILIVALITIISAYYVSFGNGTMDFLNGRIKTPPISLLMFSGSGKRIGQVGLPLVSLLGYACLPEFFHGVERIAGQQRYPKTMYYMRMSIMIAFASLAIVGILPLQSDLPLAMKKEVPISWQSLIHQLNAGFFFFFGICHMGIWLYFVTGICEKTLPFHYQNSPKSFYLKALCFLLCLFPLPGAILVHPVSPFRKKLSFTKADTGGILQYILVTCVASFFASYSCELLVMEQQRTQNTTTTKEQ